MMNTILFDPGGSQLSLGFSKVSELKTKVFGQRKAEESTFKATPKYSPKVLIGNWFEERPDLYTPVLEYWKTSKRNNCQCSEEERKGQQERAKGLRDSLLGRLNGDYEANFSTCYDLSYRVLPKGLDGPRPRSYNSRINKWVPEQDLTKTFGNITGYGMTEYLKALEEEYTRQSTEKPRSIYQYDYSKKRIPSLDKRHHKKRLDWNTPNLEHLNTCWSRHLGQGLHKAHLNRPFARGRY